MTHLCLFPDLWRSASAWTWQENSHFKNKKLTTPSAATQEFKKIDWETNNCLSSLITDWSSQAGGEIVPKLLGVSKILKGLCPSNCSYQYMLCLLMAHPLEGRFKSSCGLTHICHFIYETLLQMTETNRWLPGLMTFLKWLFMGKFINYSGRIRLPKLCTPKSLLHSWF